MKKKKRGCFGRLVKTFFIVIVLFFMLLSGLAYYAWKIEPGWVETTRNDVKFETFPAGAAPLKIALVADTHVGPHNTEAFVRKAADSINGLEADVVLLGGDFTSKPEFAMACARAFKDLKAKQKFAVLGGHDYQQGAEVITKEFKKTGVTVLKNGNINLGWNVWLIAIDDLTFGRPDIEKAFAGVPEDAVRVVITHNPKMFPRIKTMNCLVLTGHTHAGQLDIPGIPRNQLPGLLSYEYIRGWYHDGNSRLYVNRGLASVIPYMRFRARPEISLFTISRETPDVSGMRPNEPIDKNHPIRRTALRLLKLLKALFITDFH